MLHSKGQIYFHIVALPLAFSIIFGRHTHTRFAIFVAP